jgi:hypothetical protein
MQDLGYELRGISIPRTRVNKGKNKGGDCSRDPGPVSAYRFLWALTLRLPLCTRLSCRPYCLLNCSC